MILRIYTFNLETEALLSVNGRNSQAAYAQSKLAKMKVKSQNNPLKPTVTRVTPFAEKANPAPRYGGLIPPFCCQEQGLGIVVRHVNFG